VNWVIKIAHFICNLPGVLGRLYTHTTGTPSDWYHSRGGAGNWRRVVLGDPLLLGYTINPSRYLKLAIFIRWFQVYRIRFLRRCNGVMVADVGHCIAPHSERR